MLGRSIAARAAWGLLGAVCLLALGAPSGGVVIVTGDGSGNTTAPADDPGFAAVGRAASLSAVYMGEGWVLTADHVGTPSVTFGGVSYPAIPSTKVRFVTDPSMDADLAVYRIDGDPDLPVIALAETPPTAGVDVVTLVGQGWNREPTLTTWSASWAETPPGQSVYSGYKRVIGRAIRWGQDAVSATGLTIELAGRRTRSFATTFEENGDAVADEAHAVNGDSGGAVFVKRGGTWELAGIMFARQIWEGQLDDTAVFGNETYAADIAFYRDQILAVVSPRIPLLPWAAFAALALALAAAGRHALRAAARRA